MRCDIQYLVSARTHCIGAIPTSFILYRLKHQFYSIQILDKLGLWCFARFVLLYAKRSVENEERKVQVQDHATRTSHNDDILSRASRHPSPPSISCKNECIASCSSLCFISGETPSTGVISPTLEEMIWVRRGISQMETNMRTVLQLDRVRAPSADASLDFSGD